MCWKAAQSLRSADLAGNPAELFMIAAPMDQRCVSAAKSDLTHPAYDDRVRMALDDFLDFAVECRQRADQERTYRAKRWAGCPASNAPDVTRMAIMEAFGIMRLSFSVEAEKPSALCAKDW